MRAVFAALFVSSVMLAGCDRTNGTKAETGMPAVASATPSATAHHVAPEAPKPSPEAVGTSAGAAAAAPADVMSASAATAAADPIREAARFREVTIPAGTTLTMALTAGVSSKASSVEDPVSATLRRAIVVDGLTVVPSGSVVSGHVIEAERSGRVKGRARIGVRFTSLRADDTRYDIRTASIAREAPGTKKKDAVKVGVGAGAGAVIGAIAGGKKGAAIGSAVGAGGGTGVVLATRGEEVALGRGAVVTTRLTEPLTVRVRVP
jgi:hypothetical protein